MPFEPEPWMQALVGKVVGGKYRLERVLGAGGMGAVFEATHATVWRKVALKVLAPDAVDAPNAMARFHQEALTAASVGRRGVVDVLDFDHDPALGPFLVMEHLTGESLAARLEREGRLSPRAAVELALAVLETLAVVHERGIIHRDLKPGNLFYARGEAGDETVKILDFGISRMVVPAGRAMTQPGVVLGTPHYISPEQARAETDLDARADLYSVGALVYACIAGRTPYRGREFTEVLGQLYAGPPPPLRGLCPGLPEGLYAAIERAMARRRDDRFADARAFTAALLAVRASAPATAQASPSQGADGDATRVVRPARPAAPLEDAPTLPFNSRRGPWLLVALGLGLAALAAALLLRG